jgi:hypothetical protein
MALIDASVRTASARLREAQAIELRGDADSALAQYRKLSDARQALQHAIETSVRTAWLGVVPQEHE